MMIGNFLIQLLIGYGILILVIYVLSDFVIFPAPKASYVDRPNIIKLSTSDGSTISAIYLENPKAKYTVLFSHGNAEDLGTILPMLQEYQQQGFSVFAYDYHGYGTSEGSPSEKNTYRDIDAAYEYLTQTLKIPPAHIILHGRSLGSGPAIDLATRVPVAGLILESPLLSAARVISRIPFLPIDKYRNNQKISKIRVPIIIIHGKKDEVVPFWHGQQLFELTNAPKTFLALENVHHNDVLSIAGERYWQAIVQFADSLK